MHQATVTRISRRNWLLVIVLGLAGQIAWNLNNVWFNTFMYDKITPNPSAIAWMVGVSAVVATLTTLIMGTVSDRLGTRKPFICCGYMLWGISVIIFPMTSFFPETIIAVAAAVTAAAVMTFFGSTANDAAYSAWTTDISDETNRGVLSSAISILPLLALIIGFGLSGVLIDYFGYYTFFYFMGALVSLTGVFGFFFVQDSPELRKKDRAETGSFFTQLTGVIRPQTIRENRELFLVFLALGLFSISAQIFLPYLMIYMNNYLGFSLTVAGVAVAVPVVFAMLVAVPAGKLTDRGFGPKLAYAAPLLTAAGLWLASFVSRIYPVLVALCIGMAGFIIMTIVLTAWIKNLMPVGNRGQFEGIRMIFMVGVPMIIGPFIGSILITHYGIPTVLNGEPGFIPTPIVLQVPGVLMLFSLAPLAVIQRGGKRAGEHRGAA